MTRRPKIVISSRDLDRLEKLLDSMPANAFSGMPELEAELVRAEVVEPDEIPANIVTMNSTVRFSIDGGGDMMSKTLVYPKDLDDSGQMISVMAPVGSALLGMRQGGRIEWPRPGGGTMHIEVHEVVDQPERAGELHR
ncbi:nucleoside diphosphate kinase regulator [Wenzhouxiangella sp. AB-CW3]|uniref:nucleoside diphosphate kinase regulator n=1 Tax=Wenzhouxiangella sp. AB-CW3 TaxID=2771012 RepID=UPI00168B91AF|nr:nucleoside diphosphate kinase regulator [Wenzhouxiangella sp. AB-CW3]QOC21445.1 nucleoside diphosphate kinase regulator [Wenzhouxiangella sp. AB-CW3]